MKLAIMQPYLFPYIGYFQLINAVDKFVIYDDVNYIKRGWINRNKILLNGNTHLFTIPCNKQSQNKFINEIELGLDNKVRNKLMDMFWHAYTKAPNFVKVYGLLEAAFNYEDKNLASFLINTIQLVCHYLHIGTNFIKSSTKYADSQGIGKANRLIHISKSEGADHYINPIGGQDIYNKGYFSQFGINLSFIQTKFKTYNQFSKDFIPGLSIIDILMHNNRSTLKEMLEDYELI